MRKIFLGVTWVFLSLMIGCSGGGGGSAASGTFLYSADTGSNQLSIFAIGSGGALSAIASSPFGVGGSPIAVAVAPNKNFAYVTLSGSNSIQIYSVSSGGALTSSSTGSSSGLLPGALAIQPSGNFLFAANTGSANISVFSVNTSTGALTEIAGSPFPLQGNTASDIVVTPSGSFLYAAVPGQGAVFGYTISTSGALTQIPGALRSAGIGPTYLTVSPSEAFLYASDNFSSNVYGFSIQAGSGILFPVPNSPFGAAQGIGNNPAGLAVSSSNTYLYVANQNGGSISALTIDSAGGLTPITGSPFTSGSSPVYVIETSASVLYVSDHSANTISEFTVNTSTGALTALGGGTIATGTGPNWMALR